MQLSRQFELLFIEEKSRSTQLEQKIKEQGIKLKGVFQKSILQTKNNNNNNLYCALEIKELNCLTEVIAKRKREDNHSEIAKANRAERLGRADSK